MQIYNFDKNRNKIKEEMIIRVNKNEDKLRKNLENCSEKLYEKQRSQTLNEKEPFEIDSLNKEFNYVFNKIIGTTNLESKLIYVDVANKKINYDRFDNCDFNNIRFENCTFYGSRFENCTFTNAYFNNCNFEYENDNICYFKTCKFNNCTFYKSNLKNIAFYKSYISNNKFILSSLRNGIFNKCNIENIVFADCNLKSMKIVETNIDILNFEDEYLSKVDENTFIDELKNQSTNTENYDKNISKVYKNISAIFQKNGLLNYSGEYFYLSKCAERKYLKGMEKIKSYIFYYVCGYGERPTFALITSLEIVLIFAILYMFCGLCVNEKIIHYNINVFFYLSKKNIYLDMVDSFYFSLVTFTSVGYGDIFPIGYSVILSCVEMLLGVTMVGVWTATLARKITR